MKKLIPVMIVFALFLGACDRQPATNGLSGTASPAATQPAATELAAASPAAAVPDTGAGTIVYTIDPAQSKVTYEVGETLLSQNNRINTAVGVTQGISGEVTIDRSAPQNSSLGPVTVDISQLTSDQPRRDSTIRDRFLESARFPEATFTPTSIEGLPATIQEGVDIPLKINGDLKIRAVTKQVTFDTVVQLQGDSLTGQATTQILMSDYGFGPISIAGIVNTEDQVKVIFDFVARSKS
jgi:polyisoprenoid-binding protein YceI